MRRNPQRRDSRKPGLRRTPACLGDPSRDDWNVGECPRPAVHAVIGWRPIRVELGVLDVVVAGACPDHLDAVSDYLGEYGIPLVAPMESAVAEAMRVKGDVDSRVLVLDRAS